MLRTNFTLGALASVLACFTAFACSSTTDDCLNTSSCAPSGGSTNGGSAGKPSGGKGGGGTSGEAGQNTGGSSSGTAGTTAAGGDAGAGGGGGTPCDTSKSPTEESCLVSDDYAVFVSADGDDKNDGTKASPLASLTKAAEAANGNKIVLVCDGTYDEHVSITAAAQVYGGFKCADWTSESAKPLFKPTTSGPALKIDAAADDVLVEGVAFEVGDATAPGETALTAVVNASPKVTLRSVSLKAGKGKTGANGALAMFTFPDASTLNGNPESPVTEGGASKECACQPTLSSVGGLGGSPVAGGQSGSKGQPDLGGGAPGTPTSCGSGGTGQDGNDASATDPGDGAKTSGSASPAGWQPTNGIDGAIGSPGQGGGGGASRNALGHGGGGGCGGCGGNGGTAGKGGGGSIALLAINSPVALNASSLTTADAGNGGNGAAGQPGQQDVGSGGNSVASANSCGGGTGGKGGAGGAGGGGAGGISVGVVAKGAMQPTVSADTTIANGKAGTKGLGGAPGTNDGVAGIAQKVLPLN